MLGHSRCSGQCANALGSSADDYPETFSRQVRCRCMKSTDRKARSGMYKFVLTIFAIAIAIAAAYFFLLTPGTP